MKINLVKLILSLTLFTMPTLVQAQANWDRYEPRTLKQIVSSNCSPDMGNLQFSAKDYASIADVIFTGDSRRIAPSKRQLILALKNVKGLPENFLNYFIREYRFLEGSTEYWIPVQEPLVEGLDQDVERGERIKIYVVLAGCMKETNRLEPVFLLNRFATKADERELLTKREIADKAYAATVSVVTADRRGKPLSLGSGFFVSNKVIATSYHVIEGAFSIYVKQRGRSVNKVSVLRVDRDKDLALLQSQSLEGEPLKLFEGSDLYVGDEIYVIGTPEGLDATFSSGNISAFREIGGILHIQISAPVSHGSSGGAVINQYGEVIGVIKSQFKEGQNLNFAVASIYLAILMSGEKDIKVIPSYPK